MKSLKEKAQKEKDECLTRKIRCKIYIMEEVLKQEKNGHILEKKKKIFLKKDFAEKAVPGRFISQYFEVQC